MQLLLHLRNDTRLHNILHRDEDVISRMAVERCPEPLLVEMMTNEPDATTENKEAVEGTDLNVLIGFFTSKGAAITQEIDKADCDATIDIQDELR